MYTEKKRDEEQQRREEIMILGIQIDEVTRFYLLNLSKGVDVHV